MGVVLHLPSVCPLENDRFNLIGNVGLPDFTQEHLFVLHPFLHPQTPETELRFAFGAPLASALPFSVSPSLKVSPNFRLFAAEW